MQRPTEDRYLMKKTELENKIATLLGGRAAEKIIFDDVSTGAHNDLSRATDIARSMVVEYGMSDVVGQVYYAQEKRSKFLEMMPEGTADYSEVTAESIDGEIKAIIQTQYLRAVEILKEKEEILRKGAVILLEKEKIDAQEIKALLTSSR